MKNSLLATVLFLLLPSLGAAATVTASATIDLNTAITGSAWTGVGLPLDNEVTVNDGDRVVIDISFGKGQALSWDGSGYFQPWLMISGWYPDFNYDNPDDAGQFSWSNTNVTFKGLTAGTQLGATAGGTSCCIHLGPTSTLGNDNIARVFSGVTVSFDAQFLDSDTSRKYDSIGYISNAKLFNGSVAIVDVPHVPEVPLPASLPLVILGVGLLATVGKRRSRNYN